MNPLIIQSASLFGAGVLTSLSPCVYPMIPITVGYIGASTQSHQKAKIIAFFIGQIAAFTALGVVAATLGEIFGFSSELPAVQIGTGVMLLIMAFFSFQSKLPAFMTKWNQMTYFQGSLNKEKSFFMATVQAFFIGAITALVASPCTSPVLGGVLTTIAQAESQALGVVYMFFYATGMSLIFLLLGLGLINAKKLPRSGKWLNYFHKLSAFLLLFAGLYYIFK